MKSEQVGGNENSLCEQALAAEMQRKTCGRLVRIEAKCPSDFCFRITGCPFMNVWEAEKGFGGKAALI